MPSQRASSALQVGLGPTDRSKGFSLQGSKAFAQNRGKRPASGDTRDSVLTFAAPSHPFRAPSSLPTPAYLASPLLHPLVPLVKKLLEGQATVPEQVPQSDPHGPLHVTKPGLGGGKEGTGPNGWASGPETSVPGGQGLRE